ncbi:hypothetical protein O6H91_21G026100 [Diphasiastrum complanatum]|uniref:Uncharacterized protein n=1 Tax=Diphasiastrum complanatum TaxID=34168 RepID=A0ACC2AJ23_DIPCM|nr:hypothetical protein O6H91_21G026100 [Diphasiastrum complanatum]
MAKYSALGFRIANPLNHKQISEGIFKTKPSSRLSNLAFSKLNPVLSDLPKMVQNGEINIQFQRLLSVGLQISCTAFIIPHPCPHGLPLKTWPKLPLTYASPMILK